MDLSQLKTQAMTMFMMNPKKDGSQNDNIVAMLYTMIGMSILEYVFRNLPAVGVWIQAQAAAYFARKQKHLMDQLRPKETGPKEELSSIQLNRVYGESGKETTNNTNTEKVDAVLEYICNLDTAKHVRIDTRCSINNAEEIQVTPLIMAKVSEPSSSTTESRAIQILLYSKYLRISELRTWVDEVHANYMTEKANKLGNRIYYFNELPVEPARMQDPTGKKEIYRLETAPKQLVFTMNEFRTGKSFNNVYGDHVVELKERLDLFINHPEWYLERGIPHSIGIMLHGVPGAGKTSTIKAIANDTKRHIFNLSLRAFTTQRQLTNLFYNETVSVLDPALGTQQTFKIPLNRRVYVIEDIDCLTDVVLDRAFKEGNKKENNTEAADTNKGSPAIGGDAINLSFLLNLLDGVLESPGRILVITSNYPERLDRALIRPGRIDVRIAFTNASRSFIRDTINKFYTVNVAEDLIPESVDGKLTPAEVMESLCANFKDYEAAIQHMVARVARNSRKPSIEPVRVEPIKQEVVEEMSGSNAKEAPPDETKSKLLTMILERSDVLGLTPEERAVADKWLEENGIIKQQNQPPQLTTEEMGADTNPNQDEEQENSRMAAMKKAYDLEQKANELNQPPEDRAKKIMEDRKQKEKLQEERTKHLDKEELKKWGEYTATQLYNQRNGGEKGCNDIGLGCNDDGGELAPY